MNRLLLTILASVAATAPIAHSKGVPLEEATITRIVNDVRIFDPRKGSGPAKISQVVKDDMGVKTGVKSRAELLFQDNTLTRLGPESYFTFRPGTREMSLDSGTLLLQVPKNHGGATIRSASVTASITGTTIMLENIPNKSLKVLVLEGSLRLSLNNRVGESLSLGAGNMLILQPGARRLPEPVQVDLRRLIRSSSLVNPELFSAKNQPKPLPSMPLIAAAISEQDKLRATGALQESNLLILGKGTKVVEADNATLARLDGVTPATEKAGSTYTIATSETVATSEPAATSEADTSRITGPESTLPTPDAPAKTAATAADGQVISIGSRLSPKPGNVDIATPVMASSGPIEPGAGPSGAGGGFSIFTTDRARIKAAIEVSSNTPSRMSTNGGSIHIESLNIGPGSTGIEVTTSGQLLSLLNMTAPGPGGHIDLVTAGSKILVGGKVQADRGAIAIANDGPGGEIQIQNANIAADLIKVGALRSGGALRIGNSRISADSLLQLYGGSGTGGVYFTGNTTLDGNSLKYIAGREVRIDNGGIVTIGGGPATVFTDTPSYSTASGGNGNTSGIFRRAETPGTPYAPPLQPYANRP